MSAAGSPEQSAKRVVSKCGLIGLSAAVSQVRRREDSYKWLRGQKKLYIDPIRVPKEWMEWPSNDFWDATQYALITKNKKRRIK